MLFQMLDPPCPDLFDTVEKWAYFARFMALNSGPIRRLFPKRRGRSTGGFGGVWFASYAVQFVATGGPLAHRRTSFFRF